MKFLGKSGLSSSLNNLSIGSIKGSVDTYSNISNISDMLSGDMYVDESTGDTLLFDGSNWVNLGSIVGPRGPQGKVGPIGTGISITGADTASNIEAITDATTGASYIATDTLDRYIYTGSEWLNLGKIAAEGIDHISKTDTQDITDTYTIWLDAGETNSAGTFDVNNGNIINDNFAADTTTYSSTKIDDAIQVVDTASKARSVAMAVALS